MNPEYKPYKILETNHAPSLEILIEVELQNNYTPFGSLAVYWDPLKNQAHYVQAMILRASTEPDFE